MREDAVSKLGHTPIQKCTAPIRQLAYGGAADIFDEYCDIPNPKHASFCIMTYFYFIFA